MLRILFVVLAFCMILGCESFQNTAEDIHKSAHGDDNTKKNDTTAKNDTSNKTANTSNKTTDTSKDDDLEDPEMDDDDDPAMGSAGGAIALKAPADGATGVSIIPTFEWEYGQAPQPGMFQIHQNGAPVFTASLSSPSKTVSYKLFDSSLTGGGTVAMKGSLEANTKYTWKVQAGAASKTGTFTTGEADVQVVSPMLAATLKAIKAPYKLGPLGDNIAVGQWTEYEIKGAAGSSSKTSIVGEDDDGNFWYETKVKSAQFSYVMKFLIDTSDEHLVLKAYAGPAGGKGQEIPVMEEGKAVEAQKDYETENEDLDDETVEVPAGEFECSAKMTTMTKKDGSYKAETTNYMSDDVPLSGLVKSVMKGKASGTAFSSETVLIGKGSDAKSELETDGSGESSEEEEEEEEEDGDIDEDDFEEDEE